MVVVFVVIVFTVVVVGVVSLLLGGGVRFVNVLICGCLVVGGDLLIDLLIVLLSSSLSLLSLLQGEVG